MRAIIDLVLLGILIICTWSGYKKGVLMGLGGILCIIVAVYGANLAANLFSYDVVPALKPFVSGYTERLLGGYDSKVLRHLGWEDYDYSVEDLLDRFPERRAEFAASCYEAVGINGGAAEHMAERAVTYATETGGTMTDATVHILCETISYVGCFILAFLLILIVLTVIGNLPNLSYKIPNLDTFNDVGGAALGLVTGLLFCVLLVWVLKFMGMIIGNDALSGARLGGWLLKRNFLLKYLNI